jgi:hypothetical protein
VLDLFRKGIFRFRNQSTLRVFLNSEDEPNICICNRPESSQHRKDHQDTKWDMYHNTDEELNPAHGKLYNGALV